MTLDNGLSLGAGEECTTTRTHRHRTTDLKSILDKATRVKAGDNSFLEVIAQQSLSGPKGIVHASPCTSGCPTQNSGPIASPCL